MVQVQTKASAKPQALAGVRVVDFTWVRAGPWATRWLGALGAEVIKVEWPLVGPGRRGGRAMAADVDGRNNSGHFDDTNANKLGFTVNVRSPKGMELIRRLISISDIVIENFSPRVMRNWGLGYEELCKLRPDIIYISQSGFGHTGRNTEYLTMGHSAQAVSGMTYLSGLPDKPPAGWGWSYLDDTGGMYVALSAITAVYHRNMTGHGQHVDQSQMMTGMVLNGPAHLDFSINDRPSYRPGYPPGNRNNWPGTPLVNNYRGPTVAPHNAYRTSPVGYNDWCAIACFTDDEWQRLVGVMGSPAWAIDKKFANLTGRLAHQEELDQGIEAWTKTLGKYELMERCQAAGVRAMPVQSSEDRVENDPQLRYREMYVGVEHPTLGNRKLQNAPFKLSETPVWNHIPGPLIGQHNQEILEGILGLSHEELVEGYEDGTFWPQDMERFPYVEEIIQAGSLQAEERYMVAPGSAPLRSGKEDNSSSPHGPLSGLRVLELADEKGQWCGKMMGDLGADVIKIEPPGGASTRTVGPFLDDIPNRERSLSFWHYNTSKRGITINLESEDGKNLFRHLASGADVILESFRPGYLHSLGLGYEDLSREHPGLIMCSLTPFGQTGPWRDYVTSDMLHLAAGGQMASCGYDAADEPDAPPIAAVGGQAWHMGGHFAYIGITAALVNRTVTGKGQYVDASVHEACALTTEGAISNWIDNGKVVQRQTGRHAAISPSAQTQYLCKDGKYVSIRHIGGLPPQQLQTMAKWMDGYGMAGDLLDEKYQDSAIILEEIKHIDEIVIEFIKNNTRDVVYHGFQQLGFSWGAVRSPDEQLDDGHLQDRGFWLEVEHPDLGCSFTYPGSAAIWSESPLSISRRAPLIGEHNEEVLCGELGLTRAELSVLTEAGAV